MSFPCPCGSLKSYDVCCKPCHEIGGAPSALQLMRSRYSAYALGLADYIIHTTHPRNPRCREKEEITQFSNDTFFEKLEIHEHKEEGNEAMVCFTAHLKQDGKDVSFTEKSTFEKVNGEWKYLSGEIRGEI